MAVLPEVPFSGGDEPVGYADSLTAASYAAEAVLGGPKLFSSYFRDMRYNAYDARLFRLAAANIPNNDVQPLADAMPAPGVLQRTTDTAAALEALQPLLARAGIPDGFNLIYALVTRRCDDVVAQNEIGQQYGPFRAPEALSRTVPLFAEFELDAYRAFLWAVEMNRVGYAGPEAFAAVPSHWRFILHPYFLQQASKVEVFDKGMKAHIRGDLKLALLLSNPPQEYGADYFGTVSRILYDIADEYAPQIVDGNPEIFRALLPSIMSGIFRIRDEAWLDWERLRRMPEAKQYEFARASSEAVARRNRISTPLGRVASGIYSQTNRLPDWAVAPGRLPLRAFERLTDAALSRTVARYTEAFDAP